MAIRLYNSAGIGVGPQFHPDLLTAFEFVAEPTPEDYKAAARIYRTCRAQGFTIRSTIDCVIAQLALREQRPLLTKDRDFAPIAQYTALELLPIS